MPSKRKLTAFCGYAVSLLIFLQLKSAAQICSINAGLDQTICVTQQPLTLTGTVGSSMATPALYNWIKLSGPAASIANQGALITTVSGLTPGNYVFQLSGKCIDGLFARDIVAVTVLPDAPSAIVGADTSFCHNTAIQLSANAVSAGFTGTWTVVPSFGSFSPNAHDPNAVYTAPIRAGLKKFTWTISNGACKKTDVLTVSISEPILPISAGPDDTLFCKGRCAILTGSYQGYTPQSGLWTVVSGPNTPVFSDPAKSTTKVCNMLPGDYIFRWTVTGPCANGFDEMRLHVINSKNPPASLGDQVYTNFCETPGSATEVLTGAPLSPGDSVIWTQSSGSTIATLSPDIHQSTVIAGNLTGTFPYKFTYTHFNAEGCSMVTTHTVYRSQPITGLTNPPDQELACDVTTTTFNISFNKLNTISNSLVRKAVFVSGPVDTGKVEFQSSITVGLIRTDTWLATELETPGTYIYRLEYSNSCGMVFQDIAITVSRTPGIVNAGSDIVLPCNGFSINPIGSVYSPGSFYWTQVSGPNTGILTGSNTLNPSLDGLIEGVYVIRLNNSGGNTCPVKTDEMNVIVTIHPPGTAIAGNDTTVCAGSFRLSGNDPQAIEWGTWTVSPASGVSFFPDEHAPDAIVSGLLPNSTYTFTWTIANACGSNQASRIITTSSFVSPPVPNAGYDLCMPGTTLTAMLSGSDPGISAVLWTSLTPGATVDDVHSSTTSVSFTGGSNTYHFEYALGTTGCAVLKDTIAVTIQSGLRVNAGPDINICSSAFPWSGNLQVILPSDSRWPAGEWRQLSGPGLVTLSHPVSPNTNISGSLPGLYTFEYKLQSSNECDYVADTVAVRIAAEPSTSFAGNDISSCNTLPGTVITLAANTPVTGSGYWTIINAPAGSSTPVFSNVLDPAAAISNLTQGSYQFRWNIENGPVCPASTDDLIIDVKAAADAGPDLQACSSPHIQLSGSANTSGTWSVISGSTGYTVTGISPNTAIVSGLTAAGTSPSIYTFRYSIDAVGACAATYDDMTFTNFANPSPAIAGGDRNLCFNETTVTLSGNNPANGRGSWVFESGPSVPVPGPGNNNSTDTTLNNLVAGIYVYRYQVTTSPSCAVSAQNIYIIKETKAAAQTDARFCNANAISLSATAPLLSQGTWSYISGPLASSGINFSNIHTPATYIPGIVPGTYVFRWSLPANGTCSANYDDVQVIIDAPVPAISAGANQSFCQGTVTSFAIGTTANPGISYSWSPQTMLSNPSVSQPIFQGTNNAGNYIYTLRANSGSCETFAVINIQVKPTPFANIEITDGSCGAGFRASDPGNGVINPVYTWNFGLYSNPGAATGIGPHQVSFATAANRNIQLNIQSADGCSSNASIVYAPLCVLNEKLVSFDVNRHNKDVHIQWETAAAGDYKNFVLERSDDGRAFQTITSVPSNINQKKYTYTDKSIIIGSNHIIYYRLRMTDNLNNPSYSPVKMIKIENTVYEINVWPNPFINRVNFSYEALGNEKVNIRIVDVKGSIILSEARTLNPGINKVTIEIPFMLTPGIYTLQILSKESKTKNFKIVRR